MRRLIKRFLPLLLVLCLLALPALSQADVGGFSGDSDYGGWDSGSDWDSSDYGGGTIFLPGGGFGTVIAIIVILLVLRSLSRSASKKSGNTTRGAAQGAALGGAARTAASRLRPLGDMSVKDPAFDPSALQEMIANRYVQMQNAWTAKDFEPVRPYFTDALFNQLSRQLGELKRAGRTNYVERIAVMSVQLRGWYEAGGADRMVVALKTRIVDYTVEDATGKLVSGSNAKERFMEYEWILSRPSDALTRPEGTLTSIHCPSCGAPLSINQTARCPYCESIVTVAAHDWAISEMRGVAQRTA